jgi:hypothetical protein
MNENEYRLRSQQILAEIVNINKELEKEVEKDKRIKLFEKLLDL